MLQDDGTYSHVPERIRPEWMNRVTPYTLADISNQTQVLYTAFPKAFGEMVNGAYVAFNTTPAWSSRRMPEKGEVGRRRERWCLGGGSR